MKIEHGNDGIFITLTPIMGKRALLDTCFHFLNKFDLQKRLKLTKDDSWSFGIIVNEYYYEICADDHTTLRGLLKGISETRETKLIPARDARERSGVSKIDIEVEGISQDIECAISYGLTSITTRQLSSNAQILLINKGYEIKAINLETSDPEHTYKSAWEIKW